VTWRAPSQRVSAAACWTAAWLVAFAAMHTASPQGASLEYAVKATYLYKFAPFVEWPNESAEFPAGAFTLCVVGNPPFGTTLDRAVEGQTVAGRPITIRRFAAISSDPGCTVMYVAGLDAQSAAADLAAVHGLPVLTVTDDARDPAARGIINFVITENRVRFEIDEQAAAASGLTISSKLLALATHVTQRGP